MVSFHGGFLWLEKKFYVDFKLISAITGLPLAGIDPMPFFRKDQDIVLMNNMKDKYDLSRDTIGFLISSINDHTIGFSAKVLDSRLVKNM